MSCRAARRSAFWRTGYALALVLGLVASPGGAAPNPDEPLRLSDLVIARLAGRSRPARLQLVERGLSHQDGAFRTAALEAARVFGLRELTPILNELALSSDVPESVAALDALATGADASAFAVARERLNAPSLEVRKAALGVLPALPPSIFPLAEPTILLLLRDNEPTVREKAVFALGHVGSASGVDALSPLLKDPDAEVRRATVQALAALGGHEALRLILAAVDDPNANVANMALLALSRVELGEQSQIEHEVRARMLALFAESREELEPAGLEVLLRTLRDPAHRRALRQVTSESRSLDRPWPKRLLAATSLDELRALLVTCLETTEEAGCVVALRDLGPTQDEWLVRLAREGRLSRARLLTGADLNERPLLTEYSLELVTSRQAEVRKAALGALLSRSQLEAEALEPLLVALGQPETSIEERRSVLKLLGRTHGLVARQWLAGVRSTLDPTLAELADVAWVEHTLGFGEDFDDPSSCAGLGKRWARFKHVDLVALESDWHQLNRLAACLVAQSVAANAAARAAFRRVLLDLPLSDAAARPFGNDPGLSVGLAQLVELSSGPEKLELVQIAVRLGLSKSLVASLRVPTALEPEHWRTLALASDPALPASRDPWLAALLLSRRAARNAEQAEPRALASVPGGAEALGERLLLLNLAGDTQLSPEALLELGKTGCVWLESAEPVNNILGAQMLKRLGSPSTCSDRLGQLAALAPSRWVRKKLFETVLRLQAKLPEARRLLRVCRIYEADDWVREGCLAGAPSLEPERAASHFRRVVVRDERGRRLALVPFLSFARKDDGVPSLFTSTSQGTALVPEDHEMWLPFD